MRNCDRRFSADEVRARIKTLLVTRSQKDVAELLGVSKGYLIDYIHFKREPGAKLFEGLGLQKSAPLYEVIKTSATTTEGK